MLVARGLLMLASPKSRRLFVEISSVLVVAFLAVNVHPYEAPERLWTAEDLPTVANEADNGWLVVTAPYEHEFHDGQFWQGLEQRGDELHEFMATDEARTANARVDVARELPAFVDVCAARPTCTQLPWRTLHRIAALRALDLANTGDGAESCLLLRDLIRMDVAHLDTAHSLLGFMVALSNLEEALARADTIAIRLQGSEMSGTTRAALAALAREVQGIDVEAIDLERVVVGDYLIHVEMLDSLERDESDAFELIGLPTWSSGFYSRALTLRSTNERFEHRHQRASEHDTFGALGGDERSPKQQIGWWFRNPVGKTFVDRTTVNPEPWAADLDAGLAEIARVRARLLERPAVLAASAQ
jgi:hypothetical protein